MGLINFSNFVYAKQAHPPGIITLLVKALDYSRASVRTLRYGQEAIRHKRPPSRATRDALRAGPFHLFRLHLDLRSDVLKKVTVTFPSEKVFSHRRPSGSQALVVAQCRGANLPNRRQARQNKKRRPIPRVISSVHLSPTGSICVSVVASRDRSLAFH